jgi:hypothetical protein
MTAGPGAFTGLTVHMPWWLVITHMVKVTCSGHPWGTTMHGVLAHDIHTWTPCTHWVTCNPVAASGAAQATKQALSGLHLVGIQATLYRHPQRVAAAVGWRPLRVEACTAPSTNKLHGVAPLQPHQHHTTSGSWSRVTATSYTCNDQSTAPVEHCGVQHAATSNSLCDTDTTQYLLAEAASAAVSCSHKGAPNSKQVLPQSCMAGGVTNGLGGMPGIAVASVSGWQQGLASAYQVLLKQTQVAAADTCPATIQKIYQGCGHHVSARNPTSMHPIVRQQQLGQNQSMQSARPCC